MSGRDREVHAEFMNKLAEFLDRQRVKVAPKLEGPQQDDKARALILNALVETVAFLAIEYGITSIIDDLHVSIYMEIDKRESEGMLKQ